MLELKSISKSFKANFWNKKQKVLDQINLEIPEGKIVGFVGKNGCGKTTTIKIILGIIKPDSGKVTYSSKLGIGRKDVFNKIGYLPENPKFFENLTGRSFLSLMGKLHKLSEETIENEIVKFSKRLDVLDALDKQVGKYSKGMKQKIGFISAIIHKPKLVILDEPLSGLDPVSRRIFKNILLELKSEGVSFLITSHILEDLFEVGDQIIYMKNGKVEKCLESKADNAYLLYELLKKPKLNLGQYVSRVVSHNDEKISCIIEEKNRIKFLELNMIRSEDILKIERLRFELPEYK